MNQNALLLEPIKRDTLPSQVAAKLRLDIFSGKYGIGDRLPPERDVAESLGVSRVTVRQALQELAREEWIEIVQGRGVTVLDFSRRIGLEVLPTFLAASPQAVVTPDTFITMHNFSNWLYREIFVAAAQHADAGREEKLLEIISAYDGEISARRYAEIEAAYFYELLSMGNNLILRMFFNTYNKTFTHLVDTGILTAAPLPRELYLSINTDIIRAVCGKRVEEIGAILDRNRPAIQVALGRSLSVLGINIINR